MKKGFTLMELLGAIAIIGTLTMIVIASYTGIIDSSNKNIYVSKIKLLEIAGIKYGNDNFDKIKEKTSALKSVDELISEGYIEGDNEKKDNLIDPRRGQGYIDGKVLIYYENNEIKAEYNASKIEIDLKQVGTIAIDNIKVKPKIVIPKGITLTKCDITLNKQNDVYEGFNKEYTNEDKCSQEQIFDNIPYYIDIISGQPIISHSATLEVTDNRNQIAKKQSL